MALVPGCKGVEVIETVPAAVSIEPVITRATEVNFEDGDRIGIDIIKDADGSLYASNALLAYTEGKFSGDLKWYADGGEYCSVKAYYPYDAAGFPSRFTIGGDQSTGAGKYDLMTAFKSGVKPQESPVTMVFQHQFSQLLLVMDNPSAVPVESVIFNGLYPSVDISISDDGTVVSEADYSAPTIDIKAEAVQPGQRYRAIVVPQTTPFRISVSAKGGCVVGSFPEVTMKPGYTYTVEAKVTGDGMAFSLAGEIRSWENGGVIDPDPDDPDVPDDPDDPADPDEPLPPGDRTYEEGDGYFIYGGIKYNTVKMKDGRVWMAENLRWVPEGLAPCSDISNVTAGIYCPIAINADHTAAEFSSDPAIIQSHGYLYQIETALGLAVGDLTTEEQAKSLDGAQGVCPPGWHVPTGAEIHGLIGKIATYGDIDTSAPYYDAQMGNASMALLNADGFNADSWGAVTVQDNTKTSATLMGFLKSYPDDVASGYVCGSSFASLTEKDGVITNFQFWAFMPMTSNGTFNGAKQSYRIAAPVRCIKDE